MAKKDTFNYNNKKYLEFVGKLDRLNMQREQLKKREENEKKIQTGYAGIEAVRAQPKISIGEKEKKTRTKKIQRDYAGIESIRATPKKNDINKMTSEEFLGEKLNPVQKFLRYGFGKTSTIGEKQQRYNTEAKRKRKELDTTFGQIKSNFDEYLMAATTGEQAKAIKPTGNKVIDVATAITGSLAGYLAPVGGIGSSIGGVTQTIADKTIAKIGTTKIANNILQKLNPTLAKYIAPVTSTISEGVLTSAPITALQQQKQGLNVKETLQRGLVDAIFSTGILAGVKGVKFGAGAIKNGLDEGLTMPETSNMADVKTGLQDTPNYRGNIKVNRGLGLKQKVLDTNNAEIEGFKTQPRIDLETNKIKPIINKNKTWTGRSATTKKEITKIYTPEELKKYGRVPADYYKAKPTQNDLAKVYQSIVDNPKSSETQIKKAQEQIKKVSKIESLYTIEQKNISEKQIKKPEVKKTKLNISEEVLKDKNKFDSYYNLDKKLDKDNRIKAIDRLTKDIGNRIINKSNSRTLEDVVNYYKQKYNLPNNFKINRSLRSNNKYAKIIMPKDGIKTDTEIRISINPSKSFDNQVGALRHELEHWKDSIEGYKSTEPKYAVGDTLRKTYGGKGSHKNYDFFEPDYLRQAYIKDFEKGRLETTKPIDTTVSKSKIIEETNVKEVKRESVKVEEPTKTEQSKVTQPKSKNIYKLVKEKGKFKLKKSGIDYSKMTIQQIKGVAEESKLSKKYVMDSHINKYLKPTMKLGYEKGGLNVDMHGDVIGRTGTVSYKEPWYVEFVKKNNRPPSKNDLVEIAEMHLREGFTTSQGFEQPSKIWKELDFTEKEATNYINSKNIKKAYAPPKQAPYTNKTIKNNPTKESRHEQTVLNSDKTDPEFKKYLSEKRPTEYETTVNQQDWDNARERLSKNNPDKIFTNIKNKNALTADDAHDLMALHEYHTKKGDLDKANEVLTELTLKGSKSGQFIQAMAVWDRQTTEGMLKLATSNKVKANAPEYLLNKESNLKTEVQELKSTIKELEKNKTANKNEIELNLKILSGKEKRLSDVTAKVKDAYALGKLTQEEYNYIKTRYDNARSKTFYDNVYQSKLKNLQGNKQNPSPKDIYKATQYADRQVLLEKTRAMQKISDLEGSTGREKFRAFQRITMLSTPSTTARNNISNALTSLVDIGIRENFVAAPIDYLTAAVRTKSLVAPIKYKAASGRTTIMSPSKYIAYGKGFGKGIADIGRDIKDSIKYKEWIDTNPARENFELAGKRVYKNKVLNAADQIVRKMVTDRPFYEAAYQARLKELSIINKTKKNTPEMINNAKLYALDKVFQNNSTIAKTMTTIRKKVPPLDLIMPFTQTPSNLMDKLIDYSPVSLAKLTKQIAQSKSKPIDTKLFIDRLSRTMTGAGIAVLGYNLAEKGILTGALDKKSEKKREFQKAKGEQYYSIKIGDNYYSYDWLSPVGNILAAATDFYKSGQGKESFIDKLETSTIGGIDTVMSQSMLKGLLNLFSGYSPATGMIKSFSESTTQANPTIIKKIAASMDGYERETQAEGFLKTAKNKWISGIPKARENLGIKRDVFGQPLKSKDIVTNLFAPARSTKASTDKAIKEIDKLYQKTKNSDVLPKVAQNTISYTPKFKNFGRTIEGEKISYSLKDGKDKSEYIKMLGGEQKKAIENLFRSDDYKYAESDDEKVKIIAKTYKEAKDKAVYKFLKNKKLITE